MAITYLVLASGRGSNFEAIAKAVRDGVLSNTKILQLVSNEETAPVLEKARRFQIPSSVIAPPFRKDFHEDLFDLVETVNPNYLLLAGFMRILKGKILQTFKNRILNIHPSLLPEFKGLAAVEQALAAKAKRTGCTVHLVTEGVDEGPILHQKELAILPTDTEETLKNRLLPLEHACFIETLKKMETQAFRVQNSKVVWE